jgi:hypothetical protein
MLFWAVTTMDSVGIALIVGGMAFLVSGLIFLIPVERKLYSSLETFEESQERTEYHLAQMRDEWREH